MTEVAVRRKVDGPEGAAPGSQEDVVDVVVGAGRWLLALVVLLTGAAALVLQVTWQRILSLHAGVDLSSSTTVVAAFLAGLGVGSLVGGRVADRCRPRRALIVLAVVEAGVAVAALASPLVLYDGYRAVAPALTGTLSVFAFNAVALLVPTTLMGMSLPLVARAVTGRVGEAGPLIGRFHAVNTLGAALGATVATWHLVGTHGYVGTTRIVVVLEAVAIALLAVLAGSLREGAVPERILRLAGGVALVAAPVAWYLAARSGRPVLWNPLLAGLGVLAGLVVLARAARPGWAPGRRSVEPGGAPPPLASGGGSETAAAPSDRAGGGATEEGSDPAAPAGRVWPWLVAYAGAGAVALGFEQVFFRLIDGVMRSNSYTFGHVLALYLVLLAAGAAVGSRLVRRVRDPRQWFLWMQVGVGVSAVASLVLVLDVLPSVGVGPRLDRWYTSDGFASGIDVAARGDLLTFGLVLPLALMAGPVLLMGAGFPFVARIVARDLARIGRGTGAMVCANLAGNVVGTLLTGFVLIDRLGVAGTYVALAVPLLLAGLAAAVRSGRTARGGVQVAVAAAFLLVAVVALPSNRELWAELNGTEPDALLLAETRACASALKDFGAGGTQLTLNGASQNGHPFDDFHVLIGLLPALAHPAPERALAVGFGIGSTSFAMLASERPDRVTSVELCGGNYDIVTDLADRGEADFVRLATDPRHEALVGDGRRHLLTHDDVYDIIVPDHSRPTSAGAGNLFSQEFFALMSSRLSADGIAAGWLPTYRVHNAATTTFPYVAAVTVASYNDSRLFLASRSPLDLRPEVLVERYDRLAAGAFPEPQRSSLRAFLADLRPECLNDGSVAAAPDPSAQNRDLHPRDEYFLENGGASEDQAVGSCG
ncbi:fused MFS/spermidine synthase [Iamia majanohamensis]|uniref:Fused MFS/spermidine synthase n=1 Tax=Iamia majanohamensis TaxID=467976 RepID=A0AAE9Y3M7_9ACTN|nr:fused MFS/spermidine synthase [Iamia majanohamensis]WCO65900.1 fused MFS/spermidine synthase [Iamia majanohamensis]